MMNNGDGVNEGYSAGPVDPDSLPMMDAIDHEILQHRDAHFSGNFAAMIEYYEQDGKGVMADFDLERLGHLWSVEKEFCVNLAGVFLATEEAEQVHRAREAYKSLRTLYEREDSDPKALLIADLILSEDEVPERELDAIVAEGGRMIPLLANLLSSETMADPLSPGYGLAPTLAALALGRIQDEKAVRPLFEAIGTRGFFHEETVVNALYHIGHPARDFLLQVVSSRPVTLDNERAAIALAAFGEDELVVNTCREQLADPSTEEFPSLRNYLQLACGEET